MHPLTVSLISASTARPGPGAPAVDGIEQVYGRSYSALLRVCTAMLEDPGEAADAVQEGFVSAIHRRSSYRGEGSLDAWVWRIVVNAARARRRRTVPLPVDTGAATASRARTDDPVADQELVRSLVRKLPERQRLVLFLRYFSGLDYREIADVAGIAVGTVSATINTAHANLRRALEEADDDR
jgi:RNA polymerase sigma factor (sigma-70 family)